MARIAGDRIEVGPLRMGPGGAVAATGVGHIGRIEVTADSGSGTFGRAGFRQAGILGFGATIPGDLTINLSAGSAGRTHRFEGTVVVSMSIVVQLHEPTLVVLDVAPVRPSDVVVEVETTGIATFVLQTLGDANREVATQVAHVVNDRVAAVADLRRIDLADLLDQVWDTELEARLGAADE
jgi:hypothetical protein